MELTKAIKERRSIRRYKSDPVPHQVIQEILENAVWAPSAQNLQPWYFLALTDPSDLRELFDMMGTSVYSHRKRLEDRFKNNPEVVEETLEFLQEMGGAPCLILAFLLKPTYSEGMIPSWVEEVVRERERIEARFAPDKGSLLGAVVLGYPDTDPRPIKRKEGRIEIR